VRCETLSNIGTIINVKPIKTRSILEVELPEKHVTNEIPNYNSAEVPQ